MAHLLCAHPDILISDELHALRYFREGYNATQVFALIKYQDERAQRRNRKKSGYDYLVEGSAQTDGKKHPLVIGDAKGAGSASILASHPELVERLRSRVGVPLRVIVQVRHPFDVIATEIRRRGWDITAAISEMQSMSDHLEKAASLLSGDEMLFQTHEELIANPKEQFERLFRFLGVEPIPAVLEACASKIWNAPHKTRSSIDWARHEQLRLIDIMRSSKYFANYLEDAEAT